MGKSREHERYVELLEDNYLMLECLKNAQDSAHLMKETTYLLERTLVHIQREMEALGYSNDLLEKAEDIVESMGSISESLIGCYRAYKELHDVTVESGEEDS